MSSQLMEMPASDSELRIDLGGWASLTWEDLEKWAGSRNVSRGRSYQRRGHVREMIQTAEGRLMATVVGNDKYQVSVWRAADKTGAESIQSHCTCPVGHKHCKHAVALIAEYFKSLDDDDSSADDDKTPDAVTSVDDSNANRVVPVANGAPPAAEPLVPSQLAAAGMGPNASSWDGSVVDHLRSKSHEELVDLVCSLLQRFSELRAEVRDCIGGTKPSHKN